MFSCILQYNNSMCLPCHLSPRIIFYPGFMLAPHNGEVADDITDQELSFMLKTPKHIFNRVLMYFEHQYLPYLCLMANSDQTIFT